MRQMTANLHISQECKNEIDKIMPDRIGRNKVTYDDLLSAILMFLKDSLEFDERDITEMIIGYRTKTMQSEQEIPQYGN